MSKVEEDGCWVVKSVEDNVVMSVAIVLVDESEPVSVVM